MKKSKKRIQKTVIFFVAASLFLCVVSCGAVDANVKDILSKLVAHDVHLPAGKIYSSDAKEGEDEYMSDALASALFGKGTFPSEFELIESFAVRISSFTVPYEYAVFKAKNISDTGKICDMCRRRIDTAKVLLKDNADEKSKAVVSSAKIYISGKYVIMLMSEDNDSALTVARKALR